ncbi:G0/G1 switch protein 2 [Erinaceus europaeus]|uniref:G0/G1 switch protein 2 n=1 Tax=Erinaceus europaeus TaxID=9365 RepID=A0A1S3WM30_ERIEU|nr:G0/G1 switch protein 2 [Erinaceus europaeus]
MEMMQELVPLARELLTRKPGRRLLRLYVLGSVLAVLGALLGLVDTVCSPFAAARHLRERQAALAALRAAHQPPGTPGAPAKPRPKNAVEPGGRVPTHRQHAS